jgi:O-antigen ligase
MLLCLKKKWVKKLLKEKKYAFNEMKGDNLTFRFLLLCFVIFIIYVRFYEMGPLQFLSPLQLTRVSMIWVMILYLFNKEVSKSFIWQEASWKWFFALQILAVALMPISIWKSNSINWLLDANVKIMAVFFLIMIVSSIRSRVFSLAKVIFISCVCVGIRIFIAIEQGMYVVDAGAKRIIGVGTLGSDDPNDLALILAMAVPLGLYSAYSCRGFNRILAFAGIIVLFAGIVFTGSRGGFLGLAAGLIVFFATLYRKNKIQFIFIIALVGMLVFAALPSEYKGRIVTMFDETEYTHTDDTHGRLGIWKRAVRSIAIRPIGYGLKNSVAANNTNAPTDLNHWVVIHNSYLEIGLDLGILGLFFYLMFLRTGFVNIKYALGNAANHKNAELLSCGLAGALGAFLISSFFLSQAYYWNQYIFIALTVGLKRTLERETMENGKE